MVDKLALRSPLTAPHCVSSQSKKSLDKEAKDQMKKNFVQCIAKRLTFKYQAVKGIL